MPGRLWRRGFLHLNLERSGGGSLWAGVLALHPQERIVVKCDVEVVHRVSVEPLHGGDTKRAGELLL